MPYKIQIFGLRFSAAPGGGDFLLWEPRPTWLSNCHLNMTVVGGGTKWIDVKIELLLIRLGENGPNFECSLGSIRFGEDKAGQGFFTPEKFLIPNAKESFRIWDGPSLDKSTLRLYFDVGPFRLDTQRPRLVVDKPVGGGARDVWVEFSSDEPFISHPGSPVSLSYAACSRLRIHSNGPYSNPPDLDWQRTPLRADTTLGDARNLRHKSWDAGPLRIPLNELHNRRTFHLEPTGSDTSPLLLYPFLPPSSAALARPAMAAMGLDAAALEFAVDRSDAGVAQLQSLTAKSADGGRIRFYGLAARNSQGYLDAPARARYELGIRLAPAGKGKQGEGGFLPGLLLKDFDAGLADGDSQSVVLGPRPDVQVTLESPAALAVSEGYLRPGFNADQFERGVLLDSSAPHLQAQLARVGVNRPGTSMRANAASSGSTTLDSGAVESFTFSGHARPGSPFLVPVVPDAAMYTPGSPTLSDFSGKANESFAALDSDNVRVEHESRMKIEPVVGAPRPSLEQLFRTQSSPAEIAPLAPGFGSHANKYRIGPYDISRIWSSNGTPETAECVVLHEQEVNDGSIALGNGSFELDNQPGKGQQIKISSITPDGGLGVKDGSPAVIGVLKLSRRQNLIDILRGEGVLQQELDSIGLLLPPTLLEATWVGLVLFAQVVDLSGFELLKRLLPPAEEDPEASKLRLRFLAISPTAGSDPDSFVIDGFAQWKHEPGKPTDWETDDQEVLVTLHEVEISWSARRLVKFHSKTSVEFRSVLGVKQLKGKTDDTLLRRIDVFGGIDRATGKVTFLAQVDQPVPLLPKNGLGPIKSLAVRRMSLTDDRGLIRVEADGEVELQPWRSGDWALGESGTTEVAFRGLGFGFPAHLSMNGEWASIDYPSMQFQLDRGWNLANWEWAKVQLTSFGYDLDRNAFDWNTLLGILGMSPGWAGGKRSLRYGFELDLGKLPFLTTNPFESLSLKFELGLPIDTDGLSVDIDDPRLAVRALGFDRMDLDLMRFLRIRVDRIDLGRKDVERDSYLCLLMENCLLQILGKTIISDFTFAYFSGARQNGFVGVYTGGISIGSGLVEVDWVLLGRNVSLKPEVAKEIVSIAPGSNIEIKNYLATAYDDGTLLPGLNRPGVGAWILAAGFRVLGQLLVGKLLFQDGVYAGIALEGTLFKRWFGYDFAMSVLYIRGQRPDEDMFRLEVFVPSVDAGGFSFNGGVIAIEIQLNGGFLIDIGYPWLAPSGERRWERGFGMMLSGLMGRGGLMVAMRESARVSQSGDMLLVEGGQAAMVGIGGSFNGGVFRVNAYAGIYYVVEGALLFYREGGGLTLVGLRVSGAVGIQVRAIGELDWWVISIRVEIVMGAEARLTIYWGLLLEHDPASPDLPNYTGPIKDKIVVRVDFVLYARVSASACIGSGWFKLCKEISTGVSMPYHKDLVLG